MPCRAKAAEFPHFKFLRQPGAKGSFNEPYDVKAGIRSTGDAFEIGFVVPHVEGERGAPSVEVYFTLPDGKSYRRYAAKLGRGNVYVTGGDFENPDDECTWVVCSYFPDEGKVYLLNLDYEQSHKFVLHHFGEKDFVTLAPAEFRILDSVKLDPEEKLNEK